MDKKLTATLAEKAYGALTGFGKRGAWPIDIARALDVSKHVAKRALEQLAVEGRAHRTDTFWYAECGKQNSKLRVVAKPLMMMEPAEFEHAMDRACLDNYVAILRSAGSEETADLACVVLTEIDGSRKLVLHNAEYGDAEGIGLAKEFCARIRRRHLLQLGQRIDTVVFKLPVTVILANSEIIR